MKILFLGEALSPHLQRWHQAFEKLGWDVLTASSDHGPDFSGHRLLPRADRGPARYLSLVDQTTALIREFQPHLINAHFLPTYGLVAATVNAHPWVLTLWGSDILVAGRRGLFRRLRSRHILKRADMVVADSRHALGVAESIATLQRRLVVSFGVRQSWYESGSIRKILDAPILRVLSTRRLEPLYDVATLIKAAAILRDSGFQYHLTVAGDGSQAANLHALAAQFQLGDLVTFAGYQSDEQLFNLYRTHDVYVSTATSDSSSVSLLEAMSQRLYPIVADIPGNQEWLSAPPYLFPVGDAAALAAKIRAAADPECRIAAWKSYWPSLEQKGIREDQMLVADKAFRKLIDEYDRTGSRHYR